MAYASFKDFCVAANLCTADQFDDWRMGYTQNGSAEDGSAEDRNKKKNSVGSLFELVREKSAKSEKDFLSLIGQAFDWKPVDLSEVKPEPEARLKISSKIASSDQLKSRRKTVTFGL